jgi:Protein of unknown function (DUF3455)
MAGAGGRLSEAAGFATLRSPHVRNDRGDDAMGQRSLNVLRALGLAPLLLAGCASTSGPPAYPIPDALKAPTDQGVSKQVHASGFQIYECQPNKDDATRLEWVLRGPEAELVDDTGHSAGKHYAGPTWEANDGSKVVGVVVARDNGPDAAAIPWLLLRAGSTTGQGAFSQVKSIQRLHTVGGKAPADGCNAAQSGQVLRVAYSADYLFYR